MALYACTVPQPTVLHRLTRERKGRVWQKETQNGSIEAPYTIGLPGRVREKPDTSSLSSLPSPTLPPFYTLPPALLTLPLEVTPLNPAGERCIAAGSGADHQRKAIYPMVTILVHFSLKIRNLVATILMIFLRVNWPNFVYFKQQRQLSVYVCCFVSCFWCFNTASGFK